MLIRILRFAGGGARDDPEIRLAWCLLAGWVSAIFSQATVYSGAQTVQYLFMLGAVGQVLMLTGQAPQFSRETKTRSPDLEQHPFRFIRVL